MHSGATMRRALLAVSLLGLLSIACASSALGTSLVDCSGHGVLVNGRCWCDWGALTSACAVQADFTRSFGRVDVRWTYDMSSSMLHVQLRANTTGWVGLIVDSTDGGMTQGMSKNRKQPLSKNSYKDLNSLPVLFSCARCCLIQEMPGSRGRRMTTPAKPSCLIVGRSITPSQIPMSRKICLT